jgi:hypothetical protein
LLEELALSSIYLKVPARPDSDDDSDRLLFDYDSWTSSLSDVRDAAQALPPGAPLRRVTVSELRCNRYDMACVAQALLRRPGALRPLPPAEAPDEAPCVPELCVRVLDFELRDYARNPRETHEDGPGVRALFAAVAAQRDLHTLCVHAQLSAPSMAALVDAAAAVPQLRALLSHTELAKSAGFAEQIARLRQLRPELRIDVAGWKEPPAAPAQQA